MIYVDKDTEPYYTSFVEAVKTIEGLGYTFPDGILIVAYKGKDTKLYGMAKHFDDSAMVEINIKIHKNKEELINTIYHELAHITNECANNEHGKKWQTLAHLIYKASRIEIKEYA